MRYRPIMIDTKSNSYARMVKAGFRFEVDVKGPPLTGWMTCVCGRKEYFYLSEKESINGKIDVAGIAEHIGSASVKHLKEDGYTPTQIISIRKSFI